MNYQRKFRKLALNIAQNQDIKSLKERSDWEITESGIPYKLDIQTQGSQVISIHMTFDSQTRYIDLKLQNEGKFHRLLQSVGLVAKFEVGNREFDKAIFVVSDSQIIGNLLKESPEIQAEILKIIGICDSHKFIFNAVNFQNSKVKIVISPKVVVTSLGKNSFEVKELFTQLASSLLSPFFKLDHMLLKKDDLFKMSGCQSTHKKYMIYNLNYSLLFLVFLSSMTVLYHAILPEYANRYALILTPAQTAKYGLLAMICVSSFVLYKSSRLPTALLHTIVFSIIAILIAARF